MSATNNTEQPSPGSRSTSGVGYLCLPYLLAATFSVGILAGDSLSIPPLSELISTISYVWLGVLLIHCLTWFAVRAAPARELITCEVIGCLGLFGYVQGRLPNTIAPTLVLCVWGLLFALLASVTWKCRNREGVVTASAFVMFATLAMAAMQVFQLGSAILNDQTRLAELPSTALATNIEPTENLPRPDIYYLVLDAYARGDVLNEMYGYDNEPFLNELRKRGFFVADQSRSNYHYTELSVASSLNVEHLSTELLRDFKTRAPLRHRIQHNAVADFLGNLGYETVAFASGKGDTECRNFDSYQNPSPALSIYQDVLLHTTAIPHLMQWLPTSTSRPADLHRNRVRETLMSIGEVADDTREPLFVFSHLLTPHPPFVFNEQGQPVDIHGQYLVADGVPFHSCFPGNDHDFYRRSYTDQLHHLNRLLLSMIDQILARDREAVIVLQGDHGPRSEMDFTDFESTNLTECFGILNAIRLPRDSDLYRDMTPVNSFRVIFNALFDTQLPMLNDDSYFETTPYCFEDVTDKAKRRPVRLHEITEHTSGQTKPVSHERRTETD